MTKRILSVILVLTVFFGGYALLPKKYNPLPTTNVCAAGVRAGAYKVKAKFTCTKLVRVGCEITTEGEYTYITTKYKNKYRTFYPGETIVIDSFGYCDGYKVGELIGVYLTRQY